MSHGSWATFVTRPVSCVLFIAIVLTFCWPVLKAAMAKKKAAAKKTEKAEEAEGEEKPKRTRKKKTEETEEPKAE